VELKDWVSFFSLYLRSPYMKRKTTKPMVPIGQVEVITSKDVWSTAMTMT
jgi:hypothetical protein